MENLLQYSINESILSFFLRVILGILFFFQGYDKVFKIKMKGVCDAFQFEFGAIKIPRWILYPSVYFTSYIELIGGLFLIFGFLKFYVLLFLGLDLIFVVTAFSMVKPMWDMHMAFPRIILLALVMYVPDNCDVFSIDCLIMKNY